MSLCEKFSEVTGEGWITSGLNVQYKVINRVLYFQCSSGNEDWKHNFQFTENVYKSSDIPFRAHRGFIEMWQSVRNEIEALDFDTIVGYSQGAALAGFAHENFFHRHGFEPMTYAFGCPRFVYKPSKQLSRRFSFFIRIKNPRDIVTMVPLMLMGYNHIGEHISLFGKAKKPKVMKWILWLSGHTPEEYRQRLTGR